MTFIGKHLHFDNRSRMMCANIEVHIFNFNKRIYNKYIEIEFIRRMRSVRKFNQEDSLKRQIKLDESAVRKFFKKLRKK